MVEWTKEIWVYISKGKIVKGFEKNEYLLMANDGENKILLITLQEKFSEVQW